MNTKTKEGARNKGNPYFLRVPWDKGGLVNTGPDICLCKTGILVITELFIGMSLDMLSFTLVGKKEKYCKRISFYLITVGKQSKK